MLTVLYSFNVLGCILCGKWLQCVFLDSVEDHWYTLSWSCVVGLTVIIKTKRQLVSLTSISSTVAFSQESDV